MTAAAFLSAILVHPDDDTARLIYADWLEERGDPRGEFIRVQVALANPALSAVERMPLIVRSEELLLSHREEWAAPVSAFGLDDDVFHRGFIEAITLTEAKFLSHAEAIFQIAPIQRVRLVGAVNRIGELARNPYLERLTELTLNVPNGLGDAGILVLASEARLDRLRHLDLTMNWIDVPGIRALAGCRRLACLRTLIVDHNHVHDMGVHALATSSHLPSLRALHLAHCEVTQTGVRYLGATTGLPQLQALNLSYNAIGDGGLRELGQAKKLSGLRELWLRGCGIGGLGARALAGSALAGRLTRLDLSDNSLVRSQHDTLRQRFGTNVCEF